MNGPSSPSFRDRRFTSRDGLSLYYRDSGDPLSPKTPVLCLPGLTRNARERALLLERAARESAA